MGSRPFRKRHCHRLLAVGAAARKPISAYLLRADIRAFAGDLAYSVTANRLALHRQAAIRRTGTLILTLIAELIAAALRAILRTQQMGLLDRADLVWTNATRIAVVAAGGPFAYAADAVSTTRFAVLGTGQSVFLTPGADAIATTWKAISRAGHGVFPSIAAPVAAIGIRIEIL